MSEMKKQAVQIIERMPDYSMVYVLKILQSVMPLAEVKAVDEYEAKIIAADKQLSEGGGTVHELIEA